MRVSELTRTELDTHVALILGWEFHQGPPPTPATPDCGHHMWFREPDNEAWRCTICHHAPRPYSTDWKVGGPVIEVLRVGIEPTDPHPFAIHHLLPKWRATVREGGRRFQVQARLPLRAAMLALVWSRNPELFEA